MVGTRDDALASRLTALVRSAAPGTLLLICAGPPPMEATAQRIDRIAGPDALSHLQRSGRYDFAVVDSAAGIPAADVAQVLARLRDLKSGGVVVVARDGACKQWHHNVLIGLGFTPFGENRGHADGARLYRFDIATYKTTPDWLSPKDWAHPELWDRFRW